MHYEVRALEGGGEKPQRFSSLADAEKTAADNSADNDKPFAVYSVGNGREFMKIVAVDGSVFYRRHVGAKGLL